jgi:hypothetical protein
MQEALELFKAEGKRINSPITMRLYAPSIGAFDLLALESEQRRLRVSTAAAHANRYAAWF